MYIVPIRLCFKRYVMAKKFQLTELKVTSYVTLLKEGEQETAKGGFFASRRASIESPSFKYSWTQNKSQIKVELGGVFSQGSNKSNGG